MKGNLFQQEIEDKGKLLHNVLLEFTWCQTAFILRTYVHF